MRKALLVAATAAALTTSPAVAAPPAIVGTTCGFVAIAQLGTNSFTGVVFTVDAGIDVLEPFENPVTVSVLCEVRVNGTTKDTMSAVFPVVAGGVEPIEFTMTSGDIADVCTTVTAVDTDNEASNRPRACNQATETDVPPDELCPFLPPVLCSPPFPVKVVYALPGLSI